MEKKIRKGVIILVYKESSTPLYLLVKQKNGSWSLPSGGIEAGETELEAAFRELFEETGIKTIALQETNIINRFNYDENSEGVQKAFICKYEVDEIPGTEFTEEITSTMWVNAIKAKEFLLKPNQYEIFTQITAVILPENDVNVR